MEEGLQPAVNYASRLIRPEGRVELGAWFAITAVVIGNYLYPPPADPAADAVYARHWTLYGYMTTIAGIVNPLWVYGAYSLLAQEIVDHSGVPRSQILFGTRIKQFEDWCISFVGNKETHIHEFGRGLIKSTIPNATLPLAAGQLVHTAVLKVM